MYIFPSYLWINNQSSLIFHMNSKVSNYLSTCKNCNPEEGDKQGEDKKPTLNEVTQHIKQLQIYRNSKEINLAKLRISVEVLTLPVAFNLAVTAQRDNLEERFCFASMWFFYGHSVRCH